jgi:hypothetical protein
MIKEAAERLPIGQIVYIKYHPKMVGIVTSKPRIWRFKWAIAPELVRCEVDVMWLQCPYYVSGTVETLNCKRLMPKKDNKSVEIGKAPVV